MSSMSMVLHFLPFVFFGTANAGFSTATPPSRQPLEVPSPQNHIDDDFVWHRREVMQKTVTFGALLTITASPANARSTKSRTTGYAVQHTEAEWSQMLSPQQNFILRQGGTESPYSSVLEGEDRAGLFICAGCGTPLFNSKEKFHSGTGWPR